MPVHIKDINVQNLGPHNRLSFELKRFNLVYGHNEHGKTFLVEFIIRSLFRQTKRWQLRAEAGRGKVRLSGLRENALADFSPSSRKKLEDYLEADHLGLPPDFSKILVVKGAEADLADVDGGIDRAVLKRLLSNKETLDRIEARISATLRKAIIQNCRPKGDMRGEIKELEDLERRLGQLQKLLDQVDKGYSGGKRQTLAERCAALAGASEKLLRAKRHLAHSESQKLRRLQSACEALSTAAVASLKSNLDQYENDAAALRQKQREQKAAAERSQHYEWLRSARDHYQLALQREVAPPRKIMLVAATLLGVIAGGLSFLQLPIYAALALVAALALAWLHTRETQSYFARAAENQEIASLRASFEQTFNRPLRGLPDIANLLQARERDYNSAQLLAEQIRKDETRLGQTRLELARKFQQLAGREVEEATWKTCLGELEAKSRQLEAERAACDRRLAQLNVDPSDYLRDAPGEEYSQLAYDELTARLAKTRRELEEENQKLGTLKQLVCAETGDDIATPWESALANLRDVYTRARTDYQEKTAEILGKLAVRDALLKLREEEDAKIVETLKSPFIQEPLFQLTQRYQRIELEGKQLVVSDPFDSFALADLSTGAREQILLGLRIGIGAKMMRGESLFLILDDAFQYSDWRRRELLVDKAAELAESGWQIIYFSMDDNIRALFDRAGKAFGDDYRLIDLNQQRKSEAEVGRA